MENRGNRTSEELAQAKTELYGFRSSARAARHTPDEPGVIPPAIRIEFERGVNQFQPGDFLSCEYFVELQPEHDVQAIEASVIWITEGKGDSDIGVHFFERRQRQSLTSETFKQGQRLSTVLPASPLSYEGKIVKLHWCVRVRIFLTESEQSTKDELFRLGQVCPFDQSNAESTESNQTDSGAQSTATNSPEQGAA